MEFYRFLLIYLVYLCNANKRKTLCESEIIVNYWNWPMISFGKYLPLLWRTWGRRPVGSRRAGGARSRRRRRRPSGPCGRWRACAAARARAAAAPPPATATRYARAHAPHTMPPDTPIRKHQRAITYRNTLMNINWNNENTRYDTHSTKCGPVKPPRTTVGATVGL